MKQEVDSK